MTASREQQAVSSKKPGTKQMIKQILTGLLTVFLPTLSFADAQQPMKAPRVGLAAVRISASWAEMISAFCAKGQPQFRFA